jgi:hypothetical protein
MLLQYSGIYEQQVATNREECSQALKDLNGVATVAF